MISWLLLPSLCFGSELTFFLRLLHSLIRRKMFSTRCTCHLCCRCVSLAEGNGQQFAEHQKWLTFLFKSRNRHQNSVSSFWNLLYACVYDDLHLTAHWLSPCSPSSLQLVAWCDVCHWRCSPGTWGMATEQLPCQSELQRGSTKLSALYFSNQKWGHVIGHTICSRLQIYFERA